VGGQGRGGDLLLRRGGGKEGGKGKGKGREPVKEEQSPLTRKRDSRLTLVGAICLQSTQSNV